MFENTNKPTGIKRAFLATKNSLNAFKWLMKNESAFKQEVLMLVLLIPITCYVDITLKEQVGLIVSLLFIVFTEVINTAIEVVVDRIGLEIHPLSGLAKDLGSAAVLLSLLIAVLVWLAILLPDNLIS
jgi:diacylglycerol kinase (ATP)